MRREVIEGARAGDRQAFETLAASVIDRLYGAALLILHDRALAEDAVQEALLRAWRDLPRLRDPGRLEPWLHRVLLHACLDAARHERRTASRAEVPEWAHERHSLESGVENREVVERGLGFLTPVQRGVLVLRYFLDLTVPQMAEVMRVPVGTAKSRLHTAEKAMRAALDADSRSVSVEGERA